MELDGKVAWVTGAGKRIGRAIALELARRGCDVAVHYGGSRGEAEEVVQELKGLGRRAIAAKANLASVQEINAAAGEIERDLGRLDILVNSAANFIRVKWEEVTEEVWDKSLDVNLKGSAFCALAAARLMKKSGGGKIVNFADWSGLRPYANYLPYMVSKGGVVTLTEALAVELAPEITVNAIAPGTVLPPPDADEAELETIRRNIPLKRLGSPEEIVKAVMYLLDADYVTGMVLRVDGGRYLAQPARSQNA